MRTTNASATDTQVSKSHAAIRPLVACFPQWKGRRVRVREVGPDWVHAHFTGDQTQAVVVDLATGDAALLDGPRYGGPAVVYRPVPGCALLLHSRFMGEDMGVEIVILAGAIDALAVDVAVDALLAGGLLLGGFRRARAAVVTCGAFAGIALAMAEARAKLLAKGEATAAA